MNNDYSIQTVAIDVTYHCNFKCLHCFNFSGEHDNNNKEWNIDKFKDTIQELINLKIKSISFGGGETMLRKDLIIKACNIIKSQNSTIKVALVSNGYLITNEIAEAIREAGVQSVQISFDGVREHHDWLRNRVGSYEHAVSAIKNLRNNNVTVAVSFTPTKRNIMDIDQTFEYVKSLGVKVFRCQPLMCLGRTNIFLQNEVPSYEDYRRLNYVLSRKRIENPLMYIEWGDPLNHLLTGKQSGYKLKYFTISAYGDLLVSPYLPISFGNVNLHSLHDYMEYGLIGIWKNDFLKFIVDKIVSCEEMDLSRLGLPKIFIDKIINFDIIENNIKQRTIDLINKYNCNES